MNPAPSTKMDANNYSRFSVDTLKGLFGEKVNQRYVYIYKRGRLAWNKCKPQVN